MERRRFLANGIAAGAVACIESASGPIAIQAKDIAHPQHLVNLGAKLEPVQIDLNRTAVIVVDMQNDFCSKGGLLDAQGVDVSIIQSIVPQIRSVLSAARKTGLKIIYLKMAYKPDLSDVGPQGSPNWIANRHVGERVIAPNGTVGRILIRETWNTDIIEELKPEPGDITLYKTRFSGFYQTDLDSILKSLGARSLIMTGCTTCVCIESTIRDAVFRDYSPILLSDCTAEVIGFGLPRSNHEASLLLIQQRFGWVSTSDQFIRSIGKAHA